MHQYMVKTNRGSVPVHVLAPEKFAGEYARGSRLYVSSVWLVSVLAMMTNFTQAAYRKATRGGNFSEILWAMGRDTKHISSSFVDRFSRYNHQAKYGAAGWRSLDLLYNYHEKVKPALGRNVEGRITRHWIEKIENRQAVTNRLKIAVDLLTNSFDDFAGESEVRLLSVASGSAQAVVEAMKRRPHLNVKVVLIDFDHSALDEARKLVSESGMTRPFLLRRRHYKGIGKDRSRIQTAHYRNDRLSRLSPALKSDSAGQQDQGSPARGWNFSDMQHPA